MSICRTDWPPSRGLFILFVAVAWLFTGPGGRSDAATNDPALWFPVGEELVYRVYWGVIPVAVTRVTTEWVEMDGKRLICIRYRTQSNKVIEKIFPVDDVVESLVDPAAFLPVRFSKRLSEGRYRVHEVTTFDHTNRTAHWESKLKHKTKDFPIEPDTRDIVSGMYWLRSQTFTPGDKKHYRVMADEKIYDLWVNVDKEEPVTLPVFGAVASAKITPEAAFQGFFIRKGKAWVWVSKDRRRLCTKFVGSVPVANIKALLSEVKGPGDDFWTRMTAKAAGADNAGDDAAK